MQLRYACWNAGSGEADPVVPRAWRSPLVVAPLLPRVLPPLRAPVSPVAPAAPVGPDSEGNYHKVIGEQESSDQILAGLLPAGTRLVKAFGTLSAPTLSAAAWREPERAVQFYTTDDDDAGDLVAELIRADGYEPVRVGGLDQSIRIEMFGDLHEYGALGRAVTKSEALAAV